MVETATVKVEEDFMIPTTEASVVEGTLGALLMSNTACTTMMPQARRGGCDGAAWTKSWNTLGGGRRD